MRKGFTLLELLIVIIIIGILAIFALPQFFSTADVAKNTKARQVIGEIRSAEILVKGLTGNYSDFPVTASVEGREAVRLEAITGDPYWTYAISPSAGTATASKTAACGAGCNATHVINFATGAITS